MTTIANLEVKVGANTRDLETGLRDANNRTTNFARQAGAAIRNLSVGAGAALLGMGAGAANMAIEWESAFADVKKTVSGTPQEIADLEQAIRDMATSDVLGSLENAHTTLAGIAASAGQLGVETSSIDEFTESIGLLTTASNLGAEEAATFAARFANVTGMDINTEIDNLANTIVHLGNNMAATETDITGFAANLASLSTFGFDESEILGYSAALASLDLNPELGSTNLIKTVTDISNAAATGSADLETFGNAAGMTATEFGNLASADPESALNAFVEGLSGMDIDEQLQTLQQLGITGSEQQRVLLTMASGYDTVSEAVGMANTAWTDSNAAQAEAAAKAETTQGAMNRLGNAMFELGSNIGEELLPGIASLAEGLVDITEGDWKSGLTTIGDGFGQIADGIAGIFTGNEDFSFADTYGPIFDDLLTIGGEIGNSMSLAFETAIFGIGQSIEGLMLDVQQGFLEGLQGMLDGMPGWMANNIPGLDGFREGLTEQLTNLDMQQIVMDQAAQMADLYNNADASVNFTNPNSEAAGIVNQANFQADVLPELDPTTASRMRADVEEQLLTAMVEGDQEAIEVLTPIATTLEIDTESVYSQANDIITGTVSDNAYSADVGVDVTVSANSIDVTGYESSLNSALSGTTVGGLPTDTGNVFHTGGTFHAPPGQTEGIAVLRDGEQVLTAGQQRSRMNQSSGGNTINITSYGENPRSLARMVQKAQAEMGY